MSTPVLVKDDWAKLKESLSKLGIDTFADGVGNFGFQYNGYHLGGYTDGDSYVEFHTAWEFDGQSNLKGTLSIKMTPEDFDSATVDDAVDILNRSKQQLIKMFPMVEVLGHRWNGFIRSSRLIVFEGVDNSGKTTVSKELIKQMPWFSWTKEPVFTTEQADRLNSDEYKGQDAKREVLFLEGRLAQQQLYNTTPCMLDRYLWTGLAYAKSFSPSIYNFCEALYTNYNIFKKPDLYIFMETPLETCYDREPALKKEPGRLEKIRQAYRDTEHLISSPIEYIDGSKSLEECIEATKQAIIKHFPDQAPFVG